MNGRTSIFLPPGGKTKTDDWTTPVEVFESLNREFLFTVDACPLMKGSEAGMSLFGTDRLMDSWRGERVFCNPPYRREIGRWLAKGREAEVAVFLVPSRTDTAWWHDHAMRADEIRFLRGRLKFGGSATPAPFPSVVLIYRGR